MTPPEFAEAVAAEVRAEMARQRKAPKEFAAVLGIHAATAGRRLSGETPLDMSEIATIAAWLDVPISTLVPDHAEVATA